MFNSEYIIIALLCVSILLFILSFLKKDKIREIESQLETLTMNVMQENYQLKKRINLLEEEILGGSDVIPPSRYNPDVQALLEELKEREQ